MYCVSVPGRSFPHRTAPRGTPHPTKYHPLPLFLPFSLSLGLWPFIFSSSQLSNNGGSTKERRSSRQSSTTTFRSSRRSSETEDRSPLAEARRVCRRLKASAHEFALAYTRSRREKAGLFWSSFICLICLPDCLAVRFCSNLILSVCLR